MASRFRSSAPRGVSESAAVRARVRAARARQARRYRGSGLHANAQLQGSAVLRTLEVDAGTDALLRDAAVRLLLSARAVHRTLRVARTIADLEGSHRVERRHCAEALQYRARMEPVLVAM